MGRNCVVRSFWYLSVFLKVVNSPNRLLDFCPNTELLKKIFRQPKLSEEKKNGWRLICIKQKKLRVTRSQNIQQCLSHKKYYKDEVSRKIN